MRISVLVLAATVAIAGCTDPVTGELIDPIDLIADNIGQQPAQANQPIEFGFNPTEDYPSRSTAYDQYSASDDGISEAQLDKLFLHIQFPQSESAVVSFLGYPSMTQGSYSYWKIAGSSSELAVYINSGTAIDFTVGY